MRRLTVAADGQNTAPRFCVDQDDVPDHADHQRIEDRQRDDAKKAELADLFKRRGEAGHRHALRGDKDDAVEHILDAQRCQEARQIRLYNNKACLLYTSPFAYSGLGSHEDHFIQYYRNDRRLDHQVLHLELDEGDKI